jgi:hypothetical protein
VESRTKDHPSEADERWLEQQEPSSRSKGSFARKDPVQRVPPVLLLVVILIAGLTGWLTALGLEAKPKSVKAARVEQRQQQQHQILDQPKVGLAEPERNILSGSTEDDTAVESELQPERDSQPRAGVSEPEGPKHYSVSHDEKLPVTDAAVGTIQRVNR